MMLDDDDPLFSEWSRAAQPETHVASPHFVVPSLAPHELSFDEEPVVRVSPERREKLQRYVKATVAACVVLCVAAGVRMGFSRVNAEAESEAPLAAAVVAVRAPGPEEHPASTAAAETAALVATEAIPPPPPAPPPPLPAPAAAEAPVPLAASPSPEPAPAQPAAQPLPAPAVAAAKPVAPPAPVASPSTGSAAAPKTAVQERELARRSLERGKLRDAVAAAERATTADPADAEAWLILGAANQELGHASAARAAFTACATSAKRGPVGECRAMLR